MALFLVASTMCCNKFQTPEIRNDKVTELQYRQKSPQKWFPETHEELDEPVSVHVRRMTPPSPSTRVLFATRFPVAQ